MPSGLLDYVKQHNEHMVTWQPEPGVRQALIIKKSEGSKLYFVVAGRSLQKVEERVTMLNRHIVIGWFCSLVILFVVVWIQKALSKSNA